MKWLSIKKDGTPNNDQRVLVYSPAYKKEEELAFRLMGGQFVKYCKEITHYAYLRPPED